MIETNCWMPDELYNDWLIEQGFEPEEQNYFIGFDLSGMCRLSWEFYGISAGRGSGIFESFAFETDITGITLDYDGLQTVEIAPEIWDNIPSATGEGLHVTHYERGRYDQRRLFGNGKGYGYRNPGML